jgi:hypothetical protein
MLKKTDINSQRQKLIVYIVLTLATLAVYWQVTQYGFVNLDDGDYVRYNRLIRLGMKGIPLAFSTIYAQFWHPLTWISLIFDYQLYGPNAGGYHFTNIILHILSTLLLFWLFNRMTGAIWKSAFIAGLFALHPLRVESVAWISERKDVLSGFFWMLTLCLYVYYTEKPAIKRYVLVLFSFVLALMSKPMVVTLPFIMILLDYWPLTRFQSQKGNLLLWQLKEKILFFVLSAVFSIITIYYQFKPSGESFPLSSRISNALVTFITYPIQILWPHDLTISYPFRFQIPLWQVFGTILLSVIISAAVIVMAKRLQYLFVGWMWYVITILPVIGIIQNGDYAMADRYTYLPSVGITVMLVWGLPSMIRSEETRKRFLFPAGIAVLAIMSVLSWKQCVYWKNSMELFNHALRVTRNNFLAHNDLGLALYEKGKMEEAINHYNKAILMAPRYAYAYNNRGTAYAQLGQYQSALDDLNKAIHLKPDYAFAYNNRAMVYFYEGNKELYCHDARTACTLGTCIALEKAKGKEYCR